MSTTEEYPPRKTNYRRKKASRRQEKQTKNKQKKHIYKRRRRPYTARRFFFTPKKIAPVSIRRTKTYLMLLPQAKNKRKQILVRTLPPTAHVRQHRSCSSNKNPSNNIAGGGGVCSESDGPQKKGPETREASSIQHEKKNLRCEKRSDCALQAYVCNQTTRRLRHTKPNIPLPPTPHPPARPKNMEPPHTQSWACTKKKHCHTSTPPPPSIR